VRLFEFGPRTVGADAELGELGVIRSRLRLVAGELRGARRAVIAAQPVRRLLQRGLELLQRRLRLPHYERALLSAREWERTPALRVCEAIWLSSLLRTGRASDAQAAWPALLASAPSLLAYRATPRDTPMSRTIDEDLDRLRSASRVPSVTEAPR